MRESLFIEYVRRVFPKLQAVIEKVNGKRNGGQTYLHKTMLRKEYSVDQKWSSASVNTTYVAADMVAMDSPLPPKMRDSVEHANGNLPKIGMKKILRESQINAINIMKAQGAAWTQIANKLIADAVACSTGIDEKNEANFLQGLSDGVVLTDDENNSGLGLRVNFNYPEANCFTTSEPGKVSEEDINRVLAKAEGEDKNTITTIMLAQSAYNALRQQGWAKLLAANYRGMPLVIKEDGTIDTEKLPTPTSSAFDEAFADVHNGIKFLKVDRTVISEKDGKRNPYKPWNENKLIFLTTEEVGALVWGRLAEATNPVNGVTYSTVDEYKLISKYSTTDPLQEFTAGQAIVLPVIENVDQIYSLEISQESIDVHETAQAGTASAKAKAASNTKKETAKETAAA